MPLLRMVFFLYNQGTILTSKKVGSDLIQFTVHIQISPVVTKIFLIDLCLLIQNLESYIDIICSILLSPLIWKSCPTGGGE